MKINNLKIKNYLNVFNLLLITFVIFSMLIYLDLAPIFINSYKINIYGVVLFFVAMFIVSRIHFFEFDTTGDVLVFKTKKYGPFFFLEPKDSILEIPKYKLKDYKKRKGIINNTLDLYIYSKKKNEVVKIQKKVSNFSLEQQRLIISELDKILISNKSLQKNNIEYK